MQWWREKLEGGEHLKWRWRTSWYTASYRLAAFPTETRWWKSSRMSAQGWSLGRWWGQPRLAAFSSDSDWHVVPDCGNEEVHLKLRWWTLDSFNTILHHGMSANFNKQAKNCSLPRIVNKNIIIILRQPRPEASWPSSAVWSHWFLDCKIWAIIFKNKKMSRCKILQ